MPRGNKRSYILKQLKQHTCLSMYDFLLPPGIKGLTLPQLQTIVLKQFLTHSTPKFLSY